jgi:uncharacterized protein (TIGR03437 family)
LVTYSGFNANTPNTLGHVFMTSDQGATWTNISGNLPDIPVNSIALDPALPNTIFIGTDLGVFQTTDGGVTWSRLGDGLPQVATFVVRYHAASRSIVAATHGRGVYRLMLPAREAVSVSAASYSRERLARDAIASAFGIGLATSKLGAADIPLPLMLGGTRVLVRDRTGVERWAPLFYVSPEQVNYQIPPGTAIGAAIVTVISEDQTVSVGIEQIAEAAPALFAANADGKDAAAAKVQRIRDGTRLYEEIVQWNAAQNKYVLRPIDLDPDSDQVFLELYGTGIRYRSALAATQAKIGGETVEVLYAGIAPGYVGLDQINIPLSRSLRGRGEVEITFTADSKAANAVKINIK